MPDTIHGHLEKECALWYMHTYGTHVSKKELRNLVHDVRTVRRNSRQPYWTATTILNDLYRAARDSS